MLYKNGKYINSVEFEYFTFNLLFLLICIFAFNDDNNTMNAEYANVCKLTKLFNLFFWHGDLDEITYLPLDVKRATVWYLKFRKMIFKCILKSCLLT